MARSLSMIEPRHGAMPSAVAPMLAVSHSHPPHGPQWAFEYKWDGVRAVLRWDGRDLEIRSRLGNLVTARYPELHSLKSALGRRRVILDGEIVALDGEARPNFGLLQRRMHVRDSAAVRRLMLQAPVIYMLFDLMWLGRTTTTALPYEQRRELLEGLKLAGPNWQTPPYDEGPGDAMVRASKRAGLEGILAKRRDSVYEPGRRSDAWQKIKVIQQQEFVIGGWTPESTGRAAIGALLLGYYEGDKLRYVGHVGTGLKWDDHQRMLPLLKRHARSTSPFADRVPRASNFVEPVLVAQVAVRAWTHDGILRHPSFKGLRDDVDPRKVTRETVER